MAQVLAMPRIGFAKDKLMEVCPMVDVRVGKWALPTHVAWPGFVFDTLVWGTTVWVVVFALQHTRRKLRRKRGQCPTCGYLVHHRPICSECGSHVAKQ